MQVYIYIQSLETGALSSGNKEHGPDSKHSDAHTSRQALASADIPVPWETALRGAYLFSHESWQGHYENFKHTDCKVRVATLVMLHTLATQSFPGLFMCFVVVVVLTTKNNGGGGKIIISTDA